MIEIDNYQLRRAIKKILYFSEIMPKKFYDELKIENKAAERNQTTKASKLDVMEENETQNIKKQKTGSKEELALQEQQTSEFMVQTL